MIPNRCAGHRLECAEEEEVDAVASATDDDKAVKPLGKQILEVFSCQSNNISLDTLRMIAHPQHVLIMLADPQISVRRFFERPDREKQFLYRLIKEEPDPERAMLNYRRGLERINSLERYERFLRSGFYVITRDENRTIEQTLALTEKAFGLVYV